MKRNIILQKFLYALVVPAFMVACDGDDNGPSAAALDFGTISTGYYEADGTGTVTIPLRGTASASDVEFEFGGTATEGEDYEFIGKTDEGVQISIIDDDLLEGLETVRITMTSSKLGLTGNNVHTISIISNCEDVVGLEASSFAGIWAALEDYGAGGTFGPYNVTLVQDGTNPNKFTFTNFYGSGAQYIAYIIVNTADGTVSFPDQTVGAPTYDKGPLTGSSGTFSLCTEKRTMVINLNYDGGDWVYRFTKN